MIRILIADDTPDKVAKIDKALLDAKVAPQAITHVETAMDAREALATVQYDLLILDLALPARKGEAVNNNAGVDLLHELVDRDLYHRPREIVGLTAYSELQRKARGHFSQLQFFLEHYERGSTGWSDRLTARVAHMLAALNNSPTYLTDICILTALDAPELTAVRSLPWSWSKPEPLGAMSFAYRGTIQQSKTPLSVVALSAGDMGMTRSAIVATKAIETFRPRLIAMLGICGGMKKKTKIGDVILIDPTWDWQMGKYVSSSFEQAPEQLDVATEVRSRFALLADNKQMLFQAHEAFKGTRPDNIPELKAGPIPSGSAVLADEALMNDLKKQHRKVLGVEMECFGVYLAAKLASHPKPLVFGLKSVCDFGNYSKADKYQAFCAHMSASVFAAFCEQYSDVLPK